MTYHGVEAVDPNIVLAANEGRSYVDAVDVQSGKLLDRLDRRVQAVLRRADSRHRDGAVRVLVSNIGDGTLQLVEVSARTAS